LRRDIVSLPSFRNILVNILQWILTKLGTYLVLKRIWNPIDLQGHRVKFVGEGICHALCCPCFCVMWCWIVYRAHLHPYPFLLMWIEQYVHHMLYIFSLQNIKHQVWKRNAQRIQEQAVAANEKNFSSHWFFPIHDASMTSNKFQIMKHNRLA
jgi:hypothetical protein